MLRLTSTDTKQFALDEDEMLLCPYCVTFLLDSGCDHCVRSVRSSCTVRRRARVSVEGVASVSVFACALARESRTERVGVERALCAVRALQPCTFRV